MKLSVRALLFASFLLATAGVLGAGCDGTTKLKVSPDASIGASDGGRPADSPDADTMGSGGAGGSLDAAGGSLDTDSLGLGGTGGTIDASGGGDTRRVDSGEVGAVTVEVGACDGTPLNGVWRRALDGLTMILAAATGCVISGSADNVAFLHAVTGTYDDVTRTMLGSIKRTTRSSGCVTIMTATFVLTDSTHFTMAITGTDGKCDLLTSYNEATVLVKQ